MNNNGGVYLRSDITAKSTVFDLFKTHRISYQDLSRKLSDQQLHRVSHERFTHLVVHILGFIPFGGRGVVEVHAGELPALDGAEAFEKTLVNTAGARVYLLLTLQVVGTDAPEGEAVYDQRAGQRAA